jgi:hypothetical protein
VLELEEDNGRARLAAEILASDAYQTTMDKVRAFVQRGGGCRARISIFAAPVPRRGGSGIGGLFNGTLVNEKPARAVTVGMQRKAASLRCRQFRFL